MGKRWRRWTEEEREIVRRDYRQSQASRRELAARLGVSENAVAGQVARMGLAKRSDRRPWTPEEDGMLLSMVHQKNMNQIAKRLKRTVNAVTVRSNRLLVSRRIRDDWYTMNEACEILGMDHHWLRRRIENGSLKAVPQHGEKPQKAGGRCWHIEEKDLRDFIQRYPHGLNGRNVDLVQVVDILAGLKPLGTEKAEKKTSAPAAPEAPAQGERN